MLSAIKNILRHFGYVVSRYDPRYDWVEVRKRHLKQYGINVVLDVGANAGQFAQQLRLDGYSERIVSFEPLLSAYATLREAANGDRFWEVINCALGDNDGTAEINIAANSWSSSLLNMLPQHLASAPASAYVGKQVVSVQTLDRIFTKYCSMEDRVYVKIDTQGFTRQVLDGASAALNSIQGIQVELSLVPLYQDEPLIGEVLTHLYRSGFSLVMIKPEFTDPKTGQPLQVEGLLFKH